MPTTVPTRPTRRRDRRAALLLAASCAPANAAPFPPQAEVIEIADDGTAAYRTGAGAVAWVGEAQRRAGSAPASAIDALATGGVAGLALVPAPYAATIGRLSAKYDISPAMLEALVWQESRWKWNAVSRAGAVGLAQLMPGTARQLGVDARDPLANLEGGARYLRAQFDTFGGDVEKALAAYNAGPGRVLRARGVPAIAETRAYVAAIIGRLASTSAATSTSTKGN